MDAFDARFELLDEMLEEGRPRGVVPSDVHNGYDRALAIHALWVSMIKVSCPSAHASTDVSPGAFDACEELPTDCARECEGGRRWTSRAIARNT